jgi:hypothetical protein
MVSATQISTVVQANRLITSLAPGTSPSGSHLRSSRCR